MSRIVVKNLPSSINNNDLKNHFSDLDTITDVQVKLNTRGESRRFAFLGFKSQDAAKTAVEQLNNTYIGNSKISIELCKPIKESKELIKTSAVENESMLKEKNFEKKSKKEINTLPKSDPQFEEFINLQRNLEQNINTKHIWSDDLSASTPAITKESINPEKKKVHKRSRGKKSKVADKTKPKELFEHTIKITGFPQTVKRKEVKDFFKPLTLISIRNCKRDGVCYVSFKDERELRYALKKNHHFFGTSRIKILKHNVKRTKVFQEMIASKIQAKEDEFKKYDESLKDVEPINESGRLFIRNLNYTCRHEDLEELFSSYGQITEIHFPVDKKTSMPKGYAFVEFMFPENAAKAFEELNGTIFQGRNFHLIPSKPKPEVRFPRHQTFVRKDMAAVKKDETISSGSNWNSLFLGQNAVADLGADMKNQDKSQFLTQQTKKEPIAVRMALADTAAVDETRNFLISNGVELDSFNNPQAPRSRTVFLVKNLPSTTTRMELTNLMELYGKVSRVLMPPKGLTAIVEMADANEAKKLFRKLAYYRLNDSVLFLEWAPINVFREKNVEQQERQDLDELRKLQTGTKICVKNIPFEATPDELKKIFSAFGQINFIRFVKKLDGQHRGFAFVDFLTQEDALRAFSSLCHSTHLYGRRLILEWAKNDDNQKLAQ